nr:MAG TPA: hypothetical protein [Caudoviricetes sp.]
MYSNSIHINKITRITHLINLFLTNYYLSSCQTNHYSHLRVYAASV